MLASMTIKTLDDLHAIAAEHRNRALSPFDPFIINGRIKLDGYGNIGHIRFSVEGSDGKWTTVDPVTINPFITEHTLSAMFRHRHMMSEFMPDSFPTSTDRCHECGHGWTLENIHDSCSPGDVFRHLSCWRVALDRKTMGIMSGIVGDAAGLAAPGTACRIPFTLTPIENRYWPPTYQERGAFPCWCEIVTPYGRITFGQRKRVWLIDWSKMPERVRDRVIGHEWVNHDRMKGPTPESLFPTEDVTKGRDHIHAWGDAAATAYLSKIFAELMKEPP